MFEAGALLTDQWNNSFADGGKNLRRRSAIGSERGRPRGHLSLKRADAFHKEFVEVVGKDAQEAQAFEEGGAFVNRLAEHAAVKFKPTEVAAKEISRRRSRGRGQQAGNQVGEGFSDRVHGFDAFHGKPLGGADCTGEY